MFDDDFFGKLLRVISPVDSEGEARVKFFRNGVCFNGETMGYDIVSVSLTDPKNAEAAREEAVQIYRKNVIMNLLYSLK